MISVNLPGAVGGSIRSIDKQKHKILVTNPKTKLSMPYTKTITHSDREIRPCIRSFTVSGTNVTQWVSSECPSWERPNRWRSMPKKQKIKSYIDSFDEGFGVTYEFIDDGDI